MRFLVVVTCTENPCLRCRSERSPGFFLSPVAHGTFAERPRAELDARFCQGSTGKDGKHRYDVVELRADGWPLCPWCGQDELFSLAQPASRHQVAGCYRCGTTLAEAAGKHDVSRAWMGEEALANG